MALTICGIKACDSMKKAFARLDAAGTAYDFQDFKKAPPSPEQVRAWLAVVGDELVNRRGTTWRQLDAGAQAAAATPDGLVALIVDKPSLIKRPLLSDGRRVTVGLDSPLLP
ncbi:ArsC/Spx/MgsR family protein [Amnimonas aquatica]|uniref:Arsenate reductase n=1 Tax=Amnimonas aquatica TaxID=2094561 RepID=A0A2P6AVH5_9GAMM|nr:ArsC/Spx/MgsR family protein [Amnimonas aquatica]PQA52355.1 arsenate reductase [Amnimonas aquatica]